MKIQKFYIPKGWRRIRLGERIETSYKFWDRKDYRSLRAAGSYINGSSILPFRLSWAEFYTRIYIREK